MGADGALDQDAGVTQAHQKTAAATPTPADAAPAKTAAEDATRAEFAQARFVPPELGPSALAAAGAAPDNSSISASKLSELVGSEWAPGHPDILLPEPYEPLEQIAETQLSLTWKVFDHERQVPVVLKRPRAALLLEPDALQRFKTEVTLAARLSHANIVPILATHLAEPPYFFTMPLIEGVHFDQHCRAQRLSIRERVRLFLKVCRAVMHAHQNGVIHRDLKPNNILVDANGEPQLIDFGLGLRVDSGGAPAGTPTLLVMGAPGYMAPEQARGLPGDTRTDVYSLGVVLYELLAAQLPIKPASEWGEHLYRVTEGPPTAIRAVAPQIDRELAAVVMKTLRKDPAERYASVAELGGDLENWLARQPVSAVKWTAAYAARKWLQRHWMAASIASVLIAAFATLGGLAAAREARALESGRHVAAVLSGRFAVNDADPLNASRRLWHEHLRYNSRRTRFALWQFYQRYPCLYTNPENGRQMQVRCDPSGRWLASVAHDGSLILYDANSGETLQAIGPQPAQATCVRYARNSNRLFVGGGDGILRIWCYDPQTGRLESIPEELAVATVAVTALALDEADAQLATGAADGCVQVWRATPEQLWIPVQDFHVVCAPRDLYFDSSGQRLACGEMDSEDGRRAGVVAWSLGEACSLYEQHGQYRAVRFSRLGESLLVAGNSAREIDLATGAARDLPGRPGWGVRSLDTVQAGGEPLVAYGCGDGRIVFVNARTEQPLNVEGYHENSVAADIAVCFLPDGRRLASVGEDGLRMWDLSGALSHEAPVANGHADRLWRVYGDADASHLLLNSYRTDSLPVNSGEAPGEPVSFMWLLSAPEAAPVELASAGNDDTRFREAISADGRYAAVGVNSAPARSVGTCQVKMFTTCQPARSLAQYVGDSDIKYMHWIDAGQPCLLFGIHKPETLSAPLADMLYAWHLSDASAGSAPRPVRSLDGECTYVTSTPDSEWLAVSTERSSDGRLPGSVCVWRRRAPARSDATSDWDALFEEVSHFRVHDYCWNIAFVREDDGRLLVATAGSVRDIYLWDAVTGTACDRRLAGHRDCVHDCMALDEHMLVSASRDGTVRVWDVPQREEVCVLHAGDRPRIDASNGHVVIAENDGFTVATLSQLARFIAGNREYETRRAAR